MERRKLLKESPIRGLECPTIVESRSRVLTDEELGKILATAQKDRSNPLQERSTYSIIVELLIRTAQRKTQIAHLRADYIDYERRTITWPKEIMKGRRLQAREHTIPYTDEVAAILEKLPKEGYLFRGRDPKKPFNGFSKAKEEFDAKLEGVEPYRLHDFRRNFSSTCADPEMGIDPLTVERVLAHVIPGVQGIYNRFAYVAPMKAAMAKYQEHLSRITRT